MSIYISCLNLIYNENKKYSGTTRWVALMIQLEQQQHGEFVGGWGGWWLTPTTYIQLAGAGSKIVLDGILSESTNVVVFLISAYMTVGFLMSNFKVMGKFSCQIIRNL